MGAGHFGQFEFIAGTEGKTHNRSACFPRPPGRYIFIAADRRQSTTLSAGGAVKPENPQPEGLSNLRTFFSPMTRSC